LPRHLQEEESEDSIRNLSQLACEVGLKLKYKEIKSNILDWPAEN